jgi:hypothetical protein
MKTIQACPRLMAVEFFCRARGKDRAGKKRQKKKKVKKKQK